ncbi:sulfotransferase [Xanthomonas sp. NCPPB 3005]|uniref:sulfotransferase family protein n=1 Tax=Xanthomonas sp. NCPPB 3005 TaxID=3240913 RepID=UPI003516FE92
MVKAPNLFVIGAPRCGTTSLFAALKQHPDVYASVLKEPHFYAADLPAQPHTVSDPADYQRLFAVAGDQRYRAEASVWYFYSHEAPALIAKAHPDARIVLLLRNPADMLVSLYELYLRTGNEGDADPEAAIFRTGETRFATTYFPFGLHYLNLLDVTGPLSRWRQFFPEERLRLMTFEEMYAAPGAGFRDLCGWLGIDRDAAVSFDSRQAREAVRAMAMKQLRDLPEHLRRKMNPDASRLHAGKGGVAIPDALRLRLRQRARELNAGFPVAAGRPWPDAWGHA